MHLKQTLGIVVVILIGVSTPNIAQGDVAGSVQADLLNVASAVPNPQVTVALPASGSDAALVSSYTNVSVTYSPSVGSPITGIAPQSGAPPLYSTTTAELPAWDLAVLEAVKHSIVAGNQIGSVSITRNYAGLDVGSNPDLLTAAPTYTPLPSTSLTMTDTQVQTAIAQSLPAWAKNSTVVILDDAAGERAVTVSLTEPADSIGVFNPAGVLSTLLRDQWTLASQGAKIGRVVVKISDTASGAPLFTGVGDVTIAFDGAWYSPLVAAIARALPDPTNAGTQAGLLANGLESATGIRPPTP